jgi:hypothetical protein
VRRQRVRAVQPVDGARQPLRVLLPAGNGGFAAGVPAGVPPASGLSDDSGLRPEQVLRSLRSSVRPECPVQTGQPSSRVHLRGGIPRRPLRSMLSEAE